MRASSCLRGASVLILQFKVRDDFAEHVPPRSAGASRRGVDPCYELVRQHIEFDRDGYERPPERTLSEFFTMLSTSFCVRFESRAAFT